MKPKRTTRGLCAGIFGPVLVLLATVSGVNASGFPSQLELALHGEANALYAVQASSDLQHWTIVSTNRANATGAVSFHDPQAGQYGRRFYRAVQVSGPLPGADADSQGTPHQTRTPRCELITKSTSCMTSGT